MFQVQNSGFVLRKSILLRLPSSSFYFYFVLVLCHLTYQSIYRPYKFSKQFTFITESITLSFSLDIRRQLNSESGGSSAVGFSGWGRHERRPENRSVPVKVTRSTRRSVAFTDGSLYPSYTLLQREGVYRELSGLVSLCAGDKERTQKSLLTLWRRRGTLRYIH